MVNMTPTFYDLSNYKVDKKLSLNCLSFEKLQLLHEIVHTYNFKQWSEKTGIYVGSQIFILLYKAKRNVTSLHTVQCT